MKKDIQTRKGKIYIRSLEMQNPGKHDIHRAIEALLREKLDDANLDISNKLSGKPFVSGHGSLEISISHTSDQFALYISPEEVAGVDIENERSEIQKVKPLFLNATELALFASATLYDLHLIWGAKEAIYKQYEGNFPVPLTEQITIHKIDRENAVIHARSVHGEIQCFFEVESGLYIVWT